MKTSANFELAAMPDLDPLKVHRLRNANT